VSLNALNSEWVQREIAHAKSLQKRIVPLTVPGIRPPIIKLLFGEELKGVSLEEGAGSIAGALPQILAAVGEQLPAEAIRSGSGSAGRRPVVIALGCRNGSPSLIKADTRLVSRVFEGFAYAGEGMKNKPRQRNLWVTDTVEQCRES